MATSWLRSLSVLGMAAVMSVSAMAQAAPEAGSFAVYQLPEARRVKLPNGLVVLLLEKHELPLISAELMIRSGGLADPAGKEGLASVTAAMLRRGTATRSADQIANESDFMGATFAAGSTIETSLVSADFLARDTDKALALMADMVLHPALPEAEVTKLVAQRQDQLHASKDNPQQVLGSYFMQALYGANPYGRAPGGTETSLGGITRADVAAFYAKNYTPGNAVLAIAGDFHAAEMETRLKELFGAWKGGAPAVTPVAALAPVTGRHVLLVDKPDATQTYFAIGNVGLSRTSPDRAPVEIVNTLFGGRFTSMFNEELRVKSGYSYGANSRFIKYGIPGPFEMLTFTKNATTGPAIDLSFEVVKRLHGHPFTEADLTSAKNYVRGTFPPSLETTPALAHELALLETQGIPRAAFNQELVEEQTTTLAEANRVIDKDFLSDNYVLVIIGKASEIGTVAAKYGTVTTKKITDPGF
jgi:predicted Zn-dependent peptidase